MILILISLSCGRLLWSYYKRIDVLTTSEALTEERTIVSEPSHSLVSSTGGPSTSSNLTMPGISSSELLSTQPPYYNFSQIVQDYNLSKIFRPHFAPLNDNFTSHSYAWCQPQDERRNNNLLKRQGQNGITGIIYNKLPKTASSTISGIAIRLAKKCMGIKSKNELSSGMQSNKTSFHFKEHTNQKIELRRCIQERDVYQSFLFSSIRDPASRSMSRVFFDIVTRRGKNATDENVLKYLKTNHDFQFGIKSNGKGGFQLRYMTLYPTEVNSAWEMNGTKKVLNQKWIIKTVSRVMKDYDFIILVERLDECLVLIQLMLGMDTNDILYLPSKASGGYTFYYGKCRKIVKSYQSPSVAEYLSSKEWYTDAFGDYLLIEALNQSIDRTIDEVIGRRRFEDAFKKFQTMNKIANQQCSSRAIFPCGANGTNEESRKDCYENDEGCGYRCLDSLPQQ